MYKLLNKFSNRHVGLRNWEEVNDNTAMPEAAEDVTHDTAWH
jgi:hypothetical protein